MQHNSPLIVPLVGTFYRRGGKAVLAALPAGHPLVLRPEPDNPHDPGAIVALVETNTLRPITHGPDQKIAEFTTVLTNYGVDPTEFWAQPFFHLGYVKADSTAFVHPRFAPGTSELLATLGFAPDGKPTVVITS